MPTVQRTPRPPGDPAQQLETAQSTSSAVTESICLDSSREFRCSRSMQHQHIPINRANPPKPSTDGHPTPHQPTMSSFAVTGSDLRDRRTPVPGTGRRIGLPAARIPRPPGRVREAETALTRTPCPGCGVVLAPPAPAMEWSRNKVHRISSSTTSGPLWQIRRNLIPTGSPALPW
jgi:hypothetical protein